MRILLPLLAVFVLPACIELDEELVQDGPTTNNDGIGQPGPSRPDGPDDTGTPPVTADASVDPATGSTCDTLLVAISTDDAQSVSEVTFFGPSDIDVLTFAVRPGELLVTVTIPEGGATGANDILLALQGGDAVFLEDAFTVDGDGC
ncbi:MAG: hypothetical protein H6734_20870 [Alphaproteobacteria bacterium]|nr:hypothetical protein [Alphaproteobacteria bacterium]